MFAHSRTSNNNNIKKENFFYDRTPNPIYKKNTNKRRREDEEKNIVHSTQYYNEHLQLLLTCPVGDLKRKDLYKRLGVNKSDSKDIIKKAYRMLSLKLHPDKNGGADAAERFNLINQAYDILIDPMKRAKHYEEKDTSNGHGRNSCGSYYSNDPTTFTTTFQHLFETMFQTPMSSPEAQQRERAERRANTQCTTHIEHLNLTLEELALGCKKKLKFPRRVTSALKGVVPKFIEEIINVPRGAEHEQRRVYLGKGDHYGGMKKGDLCVIFKQIPHKFFLRKGSNIKCEVGINLADAVFGGEFKVRTLDNVIKLDAPGPLLGGQTFTLKGHGAYKLDSNERGNFTVIFNLKTPKRAICVKRNSEEEKSVREALNSMYDDASADADLK